MESYLMMLYVTLEQESALKNFFVEHGWSYCKPDLTVVTDKVGPVTAKLSIASEEIDVTDSHHKDEKLTQKIKIKMPTSGADTEEDSSKQCGKRKTKSQKQPTRAPKQAKIVLSTSLPDSGEIVEMQQKQNIDNEVENTSAANQPITLEMENGEQIQIKIENESRDIGEGEKLGDSLDEEEEEGNDDAEATDVDYEEEIVGGACIKTENVPVGDNSVNKVKLLDNRPAPKTMDIDDTLEFDGYDETTNISTAAKHQDDLHLSCSEEMESSQHATNYACEICNYSSKDKQNFKRHMKIHWKKNKAARLAELSKYSCATCSYTTHYKYNLRRHLQIHLQAEEREKEKKPTYACETCGKELRSKFARKIHSNSIHEKIFKFTCPTCSRGFNQLYHYKGHLASHHAKLKEKCTLCSATFTYKRSLDEHVKGFHYGANLKTVTCTVPSCDSVFSSKGAMLDHIRVEHNNTRLSCGKCSKTFKWRSSLNYHRSHAH